jgi:hypothetical protein
MLTGRQALAHAIDELAPSNVADFRKLTLWGSSNPRFDGRFVDTGWTACHAWRVLDNGRQSSSYGCLNSFTPVLVWVPTPLARSTDREGSGPQTLLKDLAHAYRDVRVPSHLDPYVTRCWELLGDPPAETRQTAHRFTYNERFVRARVDSMRRVAEALSDLTVPAPRKVLSSRYNNGLPGLDPERARLLSVALDSYASSVERAAGLRTDSTYAPFPE